MSLLIDPVADGAAIRRSAYQGDLVVLTQLPAVGHLVQYTRQELSSLFAPWTPESVHEHLSPGELAKLLGDWKPKFMHSERARQLVREVIVQAGFSAEQTHYDVPKPRTSYPVGHLTTGIAYAFPWHRDTWYSAPMQQINWWLPVSQVRADNAMAFDLPSFDRAVPNSSATFDYFRNNVARLTTASQLTQERQTRPAALGHAPPSECVVLPAPGAVLLFSGAQLHRSIPNTSGAARYSIDFRTVDLNDLESGSGAPAVDIHCTGTSVRDFRSVANDNGMDEETVVRLFGPPPADAMLVFPNGSDHS